MTAYCGRDGVIHFGELLPKGALPIARGSYSKLVLVIAGCGRLAYDNAAWLVPGVPEAATEDDALRALMIFAFRVRERLEAA